MVKVLIYSSKEIYDKASYEGRAEAHVVAYRDADEYVIMKNRTSQYLGDVVSKYRMSYILNIAEIDEWLRDKESHKLKESYKDHPYTTLMKNEPIQVHFDVTPSFSGPIKDEPV
jgi:hypothetical protein